MAQRVRARAIVVPLGGPANRASVVRIGSGSLRHRPSPAPPCRPTAPPPCRSRLHAGLATLPARRHAAPPPRPRAASASLPAAPPCRPRRHAAPPPRPRAASASMPAAPPCRPRRLAGHTALPAAPPTSLALPGCAKLSPCLHRRVPGATRHLGHEQGGSAVTLCPCCSYVPSLPF